VTPRYEGVEINGEGCGKCPMATHTVGDDIEIGRALVRSRAAALTSLRLDFENKCGTLVGMRVLLLVGLLTAACGGREAGSSTSTDNGGSSGGVNSVTARPSGVGGDCICDFKPGTGGTTSTGGYQGTGCTGALETIQRNSGLCVAKMASISAAGSYSDFSIDVTEVTQGQYDSWLATTPALPAGNNADCGYVASYAEQGAGYSGTDADHHPVVFVDWCDAYAYCQGVGKRLCGSHGGGSSSYASYADTTQSQWYSACSSGGTNAYPYGNTYQTGYCNGSDYGPDQSVLVGSMANCVTLTTGYAGVYDLSGNIAEWEDSCKSTGKASACHIRGGSFLYDLGMNSMPCGAGVGTSRGYVDDYVGFRCCSS